MRTLQQLEPYLQGYWPLKSDFKDHSQNSNDGTPTAIEWKPTSRGLKPDFNGNDSEIIVNNHSSLNFGTGDFTFSLWTKINKQDNSNPIFFMKRAGSNWFTCYMSTAGTDIRIEIAVGVFQLSDSVTLIDGKYHLLNWVRESGVVNIYCDGQDITLAQPDLSGTVSNTGDLNIGKYAGIASAQSNCKMDNFRLYNTALTADEVLNLYNSTKHAHGMIPAERSYTHQLGIKPEDGLVLGFDGHTKNADGTFTDMSGESNHGTNAGTSRDVGYFGEIRSFDGVNDYISSGNIGNIKSIEMLVELDTTTEYLLDLNATATIDINAGTIQANNFTTPTIYRDAIVQSNISADILSHIIITTGTNINATAVNFGKIVANYLDGEVKLIKLYSSELSLINVKSKFNELATLPLFHIDFIDYPDNEDVSYTDNEPIPYSTMKVGSNGTFKINDDRLVCSENTSTLTLRNNHEFDGSEYITINIGGTKYSGTGTITQGTVTVSIAQGSRFITVAMSDTDVLNSIDIQFRAEVF